MAQRVETPPPRTAPPVPENGRAQVEVDRRPHVGAPERARSLATRLFEPVDGASLAVFRILFGAIMMWEVWRYFSKGWIELYYIDPTFHFTWYGFGWVQPWPGDGMYWHFAALGLLAACIMLGLFYRVAAPLFFVGFTYVFLLEQAHYLNHFYLICLLSFLLAVVPAHRTWSLDAKVKPSIASDTVPSWSLWLLRAQIGIVFFFAGVAKINSDWLHGQPLGMWLEDRSDFRFIGRFFTEDWAKYFFSYGGLGFDLMVVPLLLWSRTRPLAFLAAIFFHTMNSKLFSIGIFPWLALGTALLFFPPDWPRRLYARLRRRPIGSQEPSAARGSRSARLRPLQGLLVGGLALYLLVQVAVPLRHFAIPGNVSWTEEGHQFSWHMKLRSKGAEARFFGRIPATGQSGELDPFRYVRDWQYTKMASRPDMIVQLARHMQRDAGSQGFANLAITARVRASLNGRQPQVLIDPKADLTEVSRVPFGGADYIVPLRTPLR